MNREHVVEFNNVRRAYQRGVDVLDGISFSVESGQVVGLLGKNGAGKTTLIRIAMGMVEAQHGTTRLFGLDPRQNPVEVKRRVGYVSEDQVLPPFLTVDEVLRVYRGLYSSWDVQVEHALLERFELGRRAKIRHLSKGQARRVALVCAVAHRPELLLLDEPAGGLDPAARQDFLEIAIQLLNESDSTILFSSHHMTDVERMADRVVLIQEGRILVDSDLDALREGYCLALVPRDCGVSRERLLAFEDCIGVREREDALHAILCVEPDSAPAALRQAFDVADVRCTRLALEEMFIELVGGQS